MATTTVAQLAAELNRSGAALLEQLQSAGVSKASTDDALTESDKERLLDHLRTSTWIVRALPLASACLISLVDLRFSVIFFRSPPVVPCAVRK